MKSGENGVAWGENLSQRASRRNKSRASKGPSKREQGCAKSPKKERGREMEIGKRSRVKEWGSFWKNHGAAEDRGGRSGKSFAKGS